MSIRKEAGLEGELNYGQKNISNVQRKLLTPDEILRLPTDKILVIIRGNKPILLDKQIYTKHPLYKSLKDTPINEYVPEWKKIKEIVKNELKAENTKLSFKTF